MANVLVRSPYYVSGSASSGSAYAQLTITIGGTLRYTLKKDLNSNFEAQFEFAELMRDYLDVEFDYDGTNSSSHSETYSHTLQFFNSAGSATTPPTTTTGFISDGYAYFDEGINHTTQKGYMATNEIIYRLEDADVWIPVDRNATQSVTFLKNGELVKYVEPSTSTTQMFQYIPTSSNGIDSFEQRIEADGGVFENTECISEYLDDYELFDIDQINILNNANELITIKVRTLSECRYKPMRLWFINRYGAQQSVWFFRKSIKQLNVTKESYQRSVLTFSGYSTYQHPKTNYNVIGNEKVTLNTGYVDESYTELMKEILLSEQVWLTDYVNDETKVLPVNVNTSSLTYKTAVNDKLVDYQLDVSFAYDTIQNIR
jgi:hypothetical protein